MDYIKTIINSLLPVDKPNVIGGLLLITLVYYLITKKRNDSNNSNVRLVVILIVGYIFRNDIYRYMFKNTKKETNKTNSNDTINTVYMYGNNTKKPLKKSHKLDGELYGLWKKIRKYRKDSPENVENIYYQLQHIQTDSKDIINKNSYIYQHISKIVDRKNEIIDILHGIEYTNNLDISLLINEVESTLSRLIKTLKDKKSTIDIDSTSGIITLDSVTSV